MVREKAGWWYAREEQAQQAAVAAARRREAALEGMVVGLVLDMFTRTALGVVASQVGICTKDDGDDDDGARVGDEGKRATTTKEEGA